MSTMVLLLGESPADPLTWLHVGDTGGLLARGYSEDFTQFSKSEAARLGETLIGLLPGELVALRLLPTPPRGQSQFLSAAGYLLEDSLAEDIDNLHICVARRGDNGLCLALSDAIMMQWHHAFTHDGLYPSILTADFLALPVNSVDKPDEDIEVETNNLDTQKGEGEPVNQPSGHLNVFTHNGGLLANGDQGGLSMDRDTADLVFAQLVDNWNPLQVDLYADKNFTVLSHRKGVIRHPVADLGTLAGLIHQGLIKSNTGQRIQAPNFLSGQYAKKLNWRGAIGPWRGAAIAASICAVLLCATSLGDSWRASREVDRLATLSREVHQWAFPQNANADPVSHARRVLTQQGGGTDFLSLWVRFSGAVESRRGIQVESFTYADEGQIVRVAILVDNLDTLSELKSALEEYGIRTREGSMNRTSNGKFSGELTVTQ